MSGFKKWHESTEAEETMSVRLGKNGKKKLERNLVCGG
jgi:hypothetical protein